MSVNDGRAKLMRASKDLFAHWERIKEDWRDDNCKQFEKKYMDLLRAELMKTQQAMDHIDQVLFRLRKDCS